MRVLKLSLITLIAVLTVAGSAFAQFVQAEPVVSTKTFISVGRLRPGDEFQLAVEAVVKDRYHVGSRDEDAAYPASLKLDAPKGIIFDGPVFPKGERIAFGDAEKIPVYEGKFVVRANGRVAKDAPLGAVKITSKLDTQACSGDVCFPPETSESSVETEVVAPGRSVARVDSGLFAPASTEPRSPSQDDAGRMRNKLANSGLVVQLLTLFGMGLLLAFTPCVYPMYPVTIGYFSGQADRHREKVWLLAGVYVLGLALTYAVLGTVASTTGGQLGKAMQLPWVLAGVAGILVLLALSMFGVYELRPPAFILNRASGKSGALGALVMGAVFGIVAAPCVGPVVLGLLLYVAQRGSPLIGFLLFFVLALGIGTPLFLVAAFAGKMPVPGMWMVTVKKVAGFLLIGAAAYFLLPVIPDSIGGYLIPAVIVVAAIYLGFFEKSVRSSRISSSVGKALGAAALVFAVWLGAPKGDPTSLQWQVYEPGVIASAAEHGKPSMLDFTAEWCGACKELERETFRDPKVIHAALRFARFRVDGTDLGDEVVVAAMRKYRVRGYPTVIFFDSSGNEIEPARVTGFVDSREFLERIEAVK
ncbi:MAG: hypothetical protein A2Z18_02445 [Armatimonadetes bacterium RBG_16_58_9]|nr:MAG: hypothetical protein A2Z18_02445 [Armatimonadetes bacterium RBG_16_58_9]